MVSRLETTTGKYVLVVASPVLKDGKFNGVVATSILLSELTERYLDPLRLGKDTKIYLINSEGVVISSPSDSLWGVNYLEYLKRLDPQVYMRVSEVFCRLR